MRPAYIVDLIAAMGVWIFYFRMDLPLVAIGWVFVCGIVVGALDANRIFPPTSTKGGE